MQEKRNEKQPLKRKLIKNDNGDTLFILAAADGELEIMKWIYRQTPNCMREVNKSKYSALHIATANSQGEVLQWLFEQHKQFNSIEISKALSLALTEGDIEIIKIILEQNILNASELFYIIAHNMKSNATAAGFIHQYMIEKYINEKDLEKLIYWLEETCKCNVIDLNLPVDMLVKYLKDLVDGVNKNSLKLANVLLTTYFNQPIRNPSILEQVTAVYENKYVEYLRNSVSKEDEVEPVILRDINELLRSSTQRKMHLAEFYQRINNFDKAYDIYNSLGVLFEKEEQKKSELSILDMLYGGRVAKFDRIQSAILSFELLTNHSKLEDVEKGRYFKKVRENLANPKSLMPDIAESDRCELMWEKKALLRFTEHYTTNDDRGWTETENVKKIIKNACAKKEIENQILLLISKIEAAQGENNEEDRQFISKFITDYCALASTSAEEVLHYAKQCQRIHCFAEAYDLYSHTLRSLGQRRFPQESAIEMTQLSLSHPIRNLNLVKAAINAVELLDRYNIQSDQKDLINNIREILAGSKNRTYVDASQLVWPMDVLQEFMRRFAGSQNNLANQEIQNQLKLLATENKQLKQEQLAYRPLGLFKNLDEHVRQNHQEQQVATEELVSHVMNFVQHN